MAEEEKRSDRRRNFEWMELFNTITTFVLFNLLWFFSALFIVTIPAVTAALFYSLGPWTRGQAPYKPLSMFAKAAWHFKLKATVIGLIDLFFLGLIVLNMLILRQMGTEQLIGTLSLTVTILAASLFILANIYLWPLLVTVDLPLKDLLKTGIRLGILHPLWGLGIAVAAVLPLAISTLLPGFFLLTVAFAAPVLIIQLGAWRIIRRYINDKDIIKIGV